MQLRQLAARSLKHVLRPFIPRRLKLAHSYWIARVAGCEPELTFLDRIGPNRGLAIDVGSNEGLFTYRLSRLYKRVHAFEINPTLADRLSRLAPSSVTVHPVGLSSEEGRATLLIPIYRGRQLNGWASLERENCSVAERYEESSVIVRSLDAFALEGVSFVKADVEGHEVELLSGARETLRRNRPMVLLEVKATNLQSVRAFFAGLGYSERTLFDLIGTAGSEGNYIFAPT